MAAQSEVKRACDLLIAPTLEALPKCPDALARAVSALTEFRSQCLEVPAGPDVRSMTRELQKDVLRARRLLQNLAGFYGGWERILGTMSGGYTAAGNPAPVTRIGRLCCRG
jgi:hypothetical protein